MERLTRKHYQGAECDAPYVTSGVVNCGDCVEGEVIYRLSAYEDFAEKWKLRIDEMDAVFRRINAMGGTDLMAQYKAIGTADQFRALKEAEQKRRSGCDFCMGDVDSRPLLLESYGGDVYICGNGTLTVGDDSTEISVCPMCGRDLRGDSQNGTEPTTGNSRRTYDVRPLL